MILSGKTIQEEVGIEPFHARSRYNGMSYGVGPAGYDVRVKQSVDLMSGEFGLFSIIEHLMMPLDVLGIVHDKSTLARIGIALQNTVIEPGWRGYLTIEISNHGPNRVRLPEGSPIAQIIFHRTDGACLAYEGKYQDQGNAPVKAIFDADQTPNEDTI